MAVKGAADADVTRSQILGPLPWQGSQWRQVAQQIEQQRLPHALLLSGSAGTGKRIFAETLAKRLLCQAPLAGLACGQCRSCHFFAADSHPDLKRLVPENKSGTLLIEQVRQLIDFVAQTSQLGGYQVILFDPVEALTPGAANAVLKCLEEPTANTCILMVSSSPSQLLPTIRSRCQMLAFPLPTESQSLTWLQYQSLEAERAQSLLAVTGGAPLAALAAVSDDWPKQQLQWFEQLGLLLDDRLDWPEVALKWAKTDPLLLLDSWLLVLQANIAAHSAGRNSQLPMYASLKRVPARRLHLFYQQLLESREGILARYNPNSQLMLEALLVDWRQLR